MGARRDFARDERQRAGRAHRADPAHRVALAGAPLLVLLGSVPPLHVLDATTCAASTTTRWPRCRGRHQEQEGRRGQRRRRGGGAQAGAAAARRAQERQRLRRDPEVRGDFGRQLVHAVARRLQRLCGVVPGGAVGGGSGGVPAVPRVVFPSSRRCTRAACAPASWCCCPPAASTPSTTRGTRLAATTRATCTRCASASSHTSSDAPRAAARPDAQGAPDAAPAPACS